MTETSLAAHVSALVKQNPARVFHFEFDGSRLWLKQVERPTGRTRIFKPGPHRKFRKELAAHEALLESGAPVAKILLKTDRYVVLEDVGPNLEQLWRREREDAEERLKATIAAAQALATMHAKNLVHGRPVARDVCWDGTKIRFLDFENHSAKRDLQNSRAYDLLLFMHSLCSQHVKDSKAIAAAIGAYRANDQFQAWEHACRIARRIGWLEVFTRPLQARKDPHAREFKSLPQMRRIFEHQDY